MVKIKTYGIVLILIGSLLLLVGCSASQTPVESPAQTSAPGSTPIPEQDSSWQDEFNLADCTLVPTGSNDYFILEPGFQIILESEIEKIAITVLDETVMVDGTETRVVEEREWRDGELIEISRNFFSLCEETRDVYYYGEEVDDIRNGEVVGHSGAWLAGENGAKPGLIMPGTPVVGMKYYQELSPGVAMDRAEVLSTTYSFETPAGTFENALRTQEGTPLNLLEKEFKTYAPGIGLIQDEKNLLTEYGYIENK